MTSSDNVAELPGKMNTKSFSEIPGLIESVAKLQFDTIEAQLKELKACDVNGTVDMLLDVNKTTKRNVLDAYNRGDHATIDKQCSAFSRILKIELDSVQDMVLRDLFK